MYITCLDLEGVLVPEIWIAFAEESGIPELKRTTREMENRRSERTRPWLKRNSGNHCKD